MENKLKVFGVTVLILIFGLFLPSFLQFRDMDSYAGRTTSSIRTETKYTDDMGAKILHDICVRKIGKKRFLLKSLNSVRVFSDYQLNSL